MKAALLKLTKAATYERIAAFRSVCWPAGLLASLFVADFNICILI